MTIVCGNLKAQSRTLGIAKTLIQRLLGASSYDLTIIDLAKHSEEVHLRQSDKIAELGRQVVESNLVALAFPAYRASYAGLLKAFLDRYPANALHGVVAIPVMAGADTGQSMVPSVTLAPLLAELGACLPFGALYIPLAQMDQIESVLDARLDDFCCTHRALMALLKSWPAIGTTCTGGVRHGF